MASLPKTVLIVDDDEGMRDTLAAILKRDYRVLVAVSGEAGLSVLKREDVDVMLLDVRMPGIGGLDVLRRVKETTTMVEVIMISAINEVETAVQAMKHGAYHYITKDFEYDALRSLVRNAVERQDLNRRVITLSAQVAEQADREFVAGPSRTVHEVREQALKIARKPTNVLILGESGTGKELLARFIHQHAERADAPFITVNLAAIPSELIESALFGHERGAFTGAHQQQLGKFELATGGTLFLDEIGDLRLDLQVKLLRAIQEGEIERLGGQRPIKTDFRLIAATNVDLEKAVREGRFREDLYYRINVVPLRMPPLRERLEDLPELVDFFVRRYNAKFHQQVSGLTPAAMEMLRAYWWPGNIRELENLIERLVALADEQWISDESLPMEYQLAQLDSTSGGRENMYQEALATFERNLIMRALARLDWNVTAAARHLGLPLSTMKHKMVRFDIRELARRFRSREPVAARTARADQDGE